MEHDAYMLDLTRFRRCIKFMNRHDMCYANMGLFMSCYSYNKHAAGWMWNELTKNQLPINCGHTELRNDSTRTMQLTTYLRETT